jgi:hypothetical protein
MHLHINYHHYHFNYFHYTPARVCVSSERGQMAMTDKKWNYLKHRSRTRGAKFEVRVPQKSGKEMFLLVWQASIHLFVYYIERKQLVMLNHKSIRDKIVKGFHDFSNVCAEYELAEIFNSMMISLCSSLREVVEEELANDEDGAVAAYARDPCCHAIVELVLYITAARGQALLREGWSNVLSVLVLFRSLGLLPAELLVLEDFQNDKGHGLESLGSLVRDQSALGDTSGLGSKTLGLVSSALSYLWTSPGGNDTDSESPAPEPESKSVEEWRAEGLRRLRALPFERLLVFKASDNDLTAAHLLKVLVRASRSTRQYEATAGNRDPPYVEDDAVFALELLFRFVLANQSRWTTTAASAATPEQKGDHPLVKSAGTAHVLDGLMLHLGDAVNSLRGDPTPEPSFYVERLVVNILRFSKKMQQMDGASVQVACDLLALLLRLPKTTFDAFGARIAIGLFLFVQTNGLFLSTPAQWQVVCELTLRLRMHRDTSVLRRTFETLKVMVEVHTTLVSFPLLMHTLYTFCLPCDDGTGHAPWHPIQPSVILAVMLTCHSRLAGSTFDRSSASASASDSEAKTGASVLQGAGSRDSLWLDSIKTFCDVCSEAKLDFTAKRQAVDVLQQALLGSKVSTESFRWDSDVWLICFETVLIPFLGSAQAMHEAQANALVAVGDKAVLQVVDIHARICSVVFQTYLFNMELLAQLPSFSMFWLNLLSCMEAFMNWGFEVDNALVRTARERLLTHLVQNVKNSILVMTQTGCFQTGLMDTRGGAHTHTRTHESPSSKQQQYGQNLWSLTWTLISSWSAGKIICKELESLRPSTNPAPASASVSVGVSDGLPHEEDNPPAQVEVPPSQTASEQDASTASDAKPALLQQADNYTPVAPSQPQADHLHL